MKRRINHCRADTLPSDINAGSQAGRAVQLDPTTFPPLGVSPFTQDGIYTIDASMNSPNPTLNGPGFTTPIQGVFHSPSSGSVADDEIAVFTFDSIDIPAGVTVKGTQNADSRPIALLSQGSVTLHGLVDVSGATGSDRNRSTNVGGAGGAAGPGGGGGGGGGEGDSEDGIPVGVGGSGGAGFVSGSAGADPGANAGGDGGGGFFGGAGGTAYGDLSVRLQGGSGGGGGGTTISGAGGGGGGGAVEIGSVAALTLAGSVHANGGAGGNDFRDGGGGAGGGILVHGSAVTLGCSAGLRAAGGSGDTIGGGGGGGRVHIVADGTITGDPTASVNVSGGPSGFGQAGGAGVLTAGTVQALPTPPTLSPTTLPDGRVGDSYSQTIAASDGTAPYTFTVTGLPAGLTATVAADSLSVTPTEGGPFSVSVTARDALGREASQSYNLTIDSNSPPVAQCRNVTVSAGDATCKAPASIDNGSFDPDSDPITVTQSPPGPYPLGMSSVTLTVTDAQGESSSCTATVTVVDQTPPVITLKPSIAFWPPNHSYRTVTVSQMVQSVSDSCTTSLSVNDVVIEQVTSDEPDNTPGGADGNTTNDIVIAAGCKSVQLRAERDDTKNGRVYVVRLRVRDASNVAARRDFKVSVPIGQSGAPAVQGAPALTKTSSCP